METLKLLLGIGTVPLGKLTVYDALHSSFRTIKLNRDPSCRLCGDSPQIHNVSNAETQTSITCPTPNSTMQSITTPELRTLLCGNFQGLLIDVREPHEHAMSSIEGARLIPLGSLKNHLAELPKDTEIYIHCKSGMRSARATEFLLDQGFTRVTNVAGGIDAWLADEAGV